MYVVNESEQRTTHTPSGAMFALAGPSQGSAEVSTWRVALDAHASTPEHAVDREQVWMPLSGTFEAEVGGRTEQVGAGQALVLGAGAVRRLRTVGGPAQALVAMAVGGQATVPGSDEKIPLPWAR
ncbi:cupin domain-containing protein [Streptomyces buecherae]|uniref:Cupin n=1 Tax=Streptomyces buecherae TaxID=2763006 RepID=A0A7H8NG48_9ACTN|nr:cupin domain-containing protein [Streptomyces buecherae]QKW53442.1 cupin [Streptomyces buecherae]